MKVKEIKIDAVYLYNGRPTIVIKKIPGKLHKQTQEAGNPNTAYNTRRRECKFLLIDGKITRAKFLSAINY